METETVVLEIETNNPKTLFGDDMLGSTTELFDEQGEPMAEAVAQSSVPAKIAPNIYQMTFHLKSPDEGALASSHQPTHQELVSVLIEDIAGFWRDSSVVSNYLPGEYLRIKEKE